MKKYFFLIFSALTLINTSCSSSDSNEQGLTETKPVGEFIDDWSFSVFPKLGDNFDLAEFKMWVPEDVSDLRAILILSNHANGGSFGWLSLDEWRNYARAEKLALMAINVKTTTADGFYTNASGGSGDALIKALDTITYKNNLTDINKLPFLMKGYSAGGVFSYYFSNFKPERIIAFVNIRGGAVGLTSDTNNNTPGLMLLGENDAVSRNQNMGGVVLSKRDKGGAFSYAIEPDVDHFGNLGPSWELTRAFFSVALDKRLTPGSNTLNIIPENTGWLGNNATKEIFTFDNYPNITKHASWLIDESFALKWKAYQAN
ncbi:hypothetical protein BFR04_15620 [Gaetbulibacter sp. 4G1]|nr:hypothetical protein [Gaetbulibacter sp. 4G1]PIA81124.1 hypothetical protein BFR04_15620 [Gaetbulibacter sp. 4G1]